LQNFAHSTFAHGWYQIGWSEEFRPGQLTSLRYFESDLIATRGPSGEVHVLDAICKHLGANMAHGGRVENECVVCPFHGWRWGLDGQHLEIPYSAQPAMARLRLRTWPVGERDGLVFVWNGPPREEPWGLPVLCPDDGRDWYRLPMITKAWPSVAIVPQLVTENSVDASHFVYVHGATSMPKLVKYDAGDSVFYTRYELEFGGHGRPTWATPAGPVDGAITNWCHGVGFTVSMLEAFDAVVDVASTTPIDNNIADHRGTVFIASNRADGSDVSSDLHRRWADHQFSQIDADMRIWENVSYRLRPALATEEVEVTRAVRKWAEGLYPQMADDASHEVAALR
jgi:nitrite reductase/ring-hydroxylating ferredoxin subunit